MKVLVLNAILYTADGGRIPKVSTIKDTMIYGMCMGFKRLGHEVTLVAAADYRPQAQDEAYDFEVLFLDTACPKFFPPSVLPYLPGLNRFLREHASDYDLVLASETFSLLSLSAARICPGKTIVWQELTGHQRKFHELPSRFWHSLVAKYGMKRVFAVVPRSKPAYEFIRRYMPMVVEKVVDHGIDLDTFSCSAVKKRQFISSSQLIYRKNVDGILRIFRDFHALPGYGDVRLLIAGRGEEEARLRELAGELGLLDGGCVEFLGFLPRGELNRHMRESMALLVNTRRDLNMVSIPEAIVSGTPVLTNLEPASAGYIRREQLGIACKDWGAGELCQMVEGNAAFVANCIRFRDRLSNVHCARQFVELMEAGRRAGG